MLADIITPIMLTLSPSFQEVPPMVYDWKTQKTVVQAADGTFRPNDTGTAYGTRSYVGSTLTIDDFNSD
jgi:hypothetical protein